MDYSFFDGMNRNSEPDTGLGGSGSQPAGGASFNPYAPPADGGTGSEPVNAAAGADASQYSSYAPGSDRGAGVLDTAEPAPAAHSPYAPPVFREQPHRAGEEYVQEKPHRAGEGLSGSVEAVNPAPVTAAEEAPPEPAVSEERPGGGAPSNPYAPPEPTSAAAAQEPPLEAIDASAAQTAADSAPARSDIPAAAESARPQTPPEPAPAAPAAEAPAVHPAAETPATPPAAKASAAPAAPAPGNRQEKPARKPAAPSSDSAHLSEEEVRYAFAQINKVVDNVETAIIGKRTAVELVFLTMLARGHALLEDVPGVGKTSLVSAIAKSVACDFKRIQFTPDLMPSDITGFSIYNQKSGEFEFRSGSAMSNIVLADEINRASAKTQSAMLEIMEEKQVTVDSQTYTMEEPFFVMATQNPVESFGTYPLPEAQIDRFMIKLSIGYPKIEEEQKILHSGKQAKTQLRAVISKEEVLELRNLADRVWVDPSVERYMVEIVAATRANAKIVLGSSPRGSISLNNAAKVYALFRNRGYVIPDDVKYLAPYILAHRIILSHDAKNDQTSPTDLINEIVSSIVAPR